MVLITMLCKLNMPFYCIQYTQTPRARLDSRLHMLSACARYLVSEMDTKAPMVVSVDANCNSSDTRYTICACMAGTRVMLTNNQDIISFDLQICSILHYILMFGTGCALFLYASYLCARTRP